MAASQLSFAGRVISVPAAVTEIDASALDIPSLGAAGIVAVMDTSIGGKPYSAIETPDDWPVASDSGKVKKLLRDGDLRELGAIMFNPSPSADIPSGAQQLVLVKVNPSVQSEVTLDNTDGDALTLTSLDYGLFTTQVHVTVSTGTDGGKKILIEFEDESELIDNLGADGKFTLEYTSGTGKAEVATVTTSASGVQLNFSRTDAGLDTGFTQPTPGDSLEVVSSNAADTTQTFTLYSLNVSNVPTATAVTLNGTSAVALTTVNLVTSMTLSATALGTVTLRKASAGATVATMLTTVVSKGRVPLAITPIDGTFTVVADGATTKQLVFRGTDTAGAAKASRVVLTGAVAVNVTGFASLTAAELGNVEAARTLTYAGTFLAADAAAYPNLQRLKDKIATMSDFTFVGLTGNLKDFDVVDLDYVTATSVFDTAPTFYAVLDDMITGINAQSQLIEAERAANATGAPTNVGPIYLAGGHEGDAGDPGTPTATTSDWQAAFDKLKEVLVNTVVVGSTDAAVHAQADDHCAFMCGQGEMERDAVCAATAGETFAALKTRALNLNTRHIRLCGQEVKLNNIAGEATWQAPKFQAALVAAMQAGAKEVGTPLTNKYVRIQDVRQHASWTPTENGNEAIQAGLLFMKRKPKKGFLIVRNITTYLAGNESVFTEAHENQEADYFAFNFRAQMEIAIGKKGFPGTPKAATAVAMGVLDLLTRPAGGRVLFSYKIPTITLDGDVLAVSVAGAVTPGINFVPITIHLEKARAAA